jgi:hypothetical protein
MTSAASFAGNYKPEEMDETNCPCLGQNTYSIEGAQVYITATSFYNATNPVLSGACVNVSGTLIINDDFTFDNCEFIMEPGAEIIVLPSTLLTINNQTVLRGCEYMWRGITLRAQARLNMENSTVMDAQYAIQVTGTYPWIRLVGNTFDANYVGFYVPLYNFQIVMSTGGNNFKDNQFINQSSYLPPFSGQTPNPGTSPYAGIFLNYIGNLTIGNPNNNSIQNSFDGLRHGIIDYKGYLNRYSGCTMTNIDAAWPEGIGVQILGSLGRINVHYCTMEQVRSGIQAVQHRTLSIKYNNIDVTSANSFNAYDAGISLSSGNRDVLIESNAITGANCIQLGLSNNGTYPVDIKANTLKPQWYGINTWLVNGKLNIVEGNTIYMDYPDANPCYTHGIVALENAGPMSVNENALSYVGIDPTCGTGIWIQDCLNGQVVGNSITAGAGTESSGAGILVANSPNHLYCCNALDLLDYGVSFFGMCNDTKLSNTLFGDHFTALQLSDALISPQIHNGNDWTGANTTWDAVFWGDNNEIPLSEFITDPDLLPNGYTQIYVPSGAQPSDWFIFDEESITTCEEWETIGEYCGNDPYYLTEDPNEFDELTASDLQALDTLQGTDTIAAVLKWEAQRYLYAKLTHNPWLINWNQAVDSFYTDAQTDLLGQFHAVETGIRQLFFEPDSLESAYQEVWEVLDSLQTEIGSLSQALLVAEEEEADSLSALIDTIVANQVIPAAQDLEGAASAIALWRSDQISALQAQNASITAATPFQQTEQFVFDLYLSTIAKEEAALTQEQRDTLESIAMKCPLIDGMGVYWARAILTHYHTATVWGLDDCEALEERSVSSEKTETATGKVFPNPVKDQLTLQLEGPLSTEGHLVIFNLNGHSVWLEKLQPGISEYTADLSGLPAGLYFYEVKETGTARLSGRIVVVK